VTSNQNASEFSHHITKQHSGKENAERPTRTGEGQRYGLIRAYRADSELTRTAELGDAELPPAIGSQSDSSQQGEDKQTPRSEHCAKDPRVISPPVDSSRSTEPSTKSCLLNAIPPELHLEILLCLADSDQRCLQHYIIANDYGRQMVEAHNEYLHRKTCRKSIAPSGHCACRWKSERIWELANVRRLRQHAKREPFVYANYIVLPRSRVTERLHKMMGLGDERKGRHYPGDI
jgi:hypothetical protein